MSSAAPTPAAPVPAARAAGRAPLARAGAPLGVGIASGYISLVVLIPLAAVAWRATGDGFGEFWDAVSAPQAVAALRLTVLVSLVVLAINAVMGTLIAWVLVRDDFRGKAFVNGLIDLPFALPTLVAGLTLLALYGPGGPIGIDLAFTSVGITVALLLVSLPFVVRSVQPVLLEMEREAEEAAASLGAGGPTIFRRIILPGLVPAVLAGSGLAFSRALGEFGAVVLIAGNVPFETELASVYIFGQIESDNPQAAAAVSVVLLVASLLALLALGAAERWTARHAN
jgi:sulfate/thiosulfate transport system permease protein